MKLDGTNHTNGFNLVIKANTFLLLKVFRYNRTLFFLRVLVAILGSVSTILTILMPMYLLQSLIYEDLSQTLNVIIVFTFSYLTIMLIGTVFSGYEKVENEKIYVAIINEFLQKTIDLDLGYFDRTDSYDRYNRAFGNCCKVIDNANAILSSFVTSVINIFLITGLLIWMDFYIFISIIVIIIISFLVSNKLKKIDYQFSVKISEKNKQLNYLYRLFYVPQYVREIKANNLSNYLFDMKQRFNYGTIELTKEQMKSKIPYNIFMGSLNILENSAVALYFGFSVIVGRIAIAEYFTCINAYNQLKNTILNLISTYTQLYSNSMFASDYLGFLSSKETVTLNKKGEMLFAIHEIKFASVSFRYPNSNVNALTDVSFTINKGEKVAILGKNGAGKTTIIKLLLRLYDPASGEILINGLNIREYNTESLRSAIQTLFQDFATYAFSIKDNVSLGRNISDDDILTALEKVQLRSKIESLEHSLDTPITSQLHANGIELSGGEAQKLAIARIYANNPKTFVMDEPTSSLDPYAETLLYSKLLEEKNTDVTVIVISHRLTLTYKMSKIIVIEQGSVVENGKHDDLMNNRGIYSDMYNEQATKFIDM